MPRSITAANAQALHKDLKDLVDKWNNKTGNFPKQKLADYEAAVNAAIAKIETDAQINS